MLAVKQDPYAIQLRCCMVPRTPKMARPAASVIPNRRSDGCRIGEMMLIGNLWAASGALSVGSVFADLENIRRNAKDLNPACRY